MLTYNLTADIKQDGHLKIDIPTSLKNAKIELLIVINPVEEKKIPKYDFSDLVGKLEWSGDAVSEQRKMRDEW